MVALGLSVATELSLAGPVPAPPPGWGLPACDVFLLEWLVREGNNPLDETAPEEVCQLLSASSAKTAEVPIQPSRASCFALVPSLLFGYTLTKSALRMLRSGALRLLPGRLGRKAEELGKWFPLPVPPAKALALALQGKGRCFNYSCLWKRCGN